MPSIQEIRQKYPQYQDLSDDQLAQGLHKRFYSDMPFENFKSKITNVNIRPVNEVDISEGPSTPQPGDFASAKTVAEINQQDGNVLQRFAGAASEGFEKGFGKKRVYDESPTQYLPSTPQTQGLNLLMNYAADTGEGALRSIAGMVRAGTHTVSQAAREMGMSRGDAKQLERDMAGMVDTAGIMTAGTNVASVGARTINKAQRQADRINDVKSFDKLGVEPFAPTLTDTELLGLFSQAASKVPFAGSPIKDTAVDLVTNVSKKAQKIADDLSPSQIDSLEEGGGIIQSGLKRFGSEKTYYKPIEELSDHELKKMIVHNPSRSLSFTTKQEALYESAWRKLPARFKSNGSKNPDLVATANSRNVLQNIERRQTQIGVSGGALQGKFSGMAEKLRNRGGLTIETMRRMRTEVGRMLGRGPDENVNMDRAQLKELYGALTKDITGGLEKIAQRASVDPKVSNSMTVNAFDAVRSFKRADQFSKKGIDRLDKVLRLANADTPERAADRLMKAALNKGHANLGMMRAAKKSLRKDEWNDMASLIIKRMGAPRPGVKGVKQDLGFSPATFATEWNKLTDQGKYLIFGGKGAPSRDAIDALVRVSDRIGGLESLANHSNTFSQGVTAFATGGGAYAASTGFFMQALGVLAGSYGFSKLVSSPKFARWLARSAQLSTRPNFGRVWASQVTQLQMMADKDPELEPFVEMLMESSSEKNQGF